MRDFRIQVFINWLRLFRKKGYRNKRWLVSYGWQWIRICLKKKNGEWQNKMFDLEDIACLRKEVLKLGNFDGRWFVRIFEPETKGIRVWEYGWLLKEIERRKIKLKGLKILDVGSGGSLLGGFLAKQGAKVTSLDLEKAMEKRDRVGKIKGWKRMVGDMTKMQFKDKSFDMVICISAIEHLDTKINGKFYSQKEYRHRTKRAITEMKRVVKKDGWIYLTT
ncbi:hypothetical protein DRH14_03720, partial [Candidatus Shapirobacteria bacterium]